ncbi:MAG: DUF192 domain-containing protein [Saprospiraceae bacterium]
MAIYSVLVAFGIFTLVGITGCASEETSSQQTEQEVMPGTTFEHEGNLSFLKGDSAITAIAIEIAETEGAITQGLMHRKSMSFNKGMLFIFPDSEERSFWMKNTIIPLDIIYVNDKLEIVSIKSHTTPFSTDSVPSDGKAAKYVIEVNAGFAGKYGIQEGDLVSFERL